MKIEENVERAHFPRQMSHGENSGGFPLFLFKSLESWNVTPLEKWPQNKLASLTFCSSLILTSYLTQFIDSLNTEHCLTLSMHKL